MAIHIVLIEPEIPNNTGNIGRLTLAVGAKLHLVKPFGFELSDKRVKRAGLDYWQYVDIEIHESADAFFLKYGHEQLALMSSHGTKEYTEIEPGENIFLIFGKESAGLGEELRGKYKEVLYGIPIMSTHVRSLNLANAVSIVAYYCLGRLRGSHK